MHFKTFLKTCEVDDPMEFDFINDAKSDSRFPDVRTLAALTSYLYHRGAPYQAIEAAEQLWQKYDESRKPQLLV
ncbi:YozE family protein [Paracoccus sp. S1E-3]|uniref:YozE family protein n=1 Tax=Paracoccus sp. S1E-3 TaxID=2756130 RepID=UPI0015EED5D6|nr:YozE family protein [Paracoccus sp. S1E-3]MBA4491884.1 hypothetical protein [Paracoccus sp. S1E-3]